MVPHLVRPVGLHLLMRLCDWSIFSTGDCLLGQYIVPHSTLRHALCVRLGLLLWFRLQSLGHSHSYFVLLYFFLSSRTVGSWFLLWIWFLVQFSQCFCLLVLLFFPQLLLVFEVFFEWFSLSISFLVCFLHVFFGFFYAGGVSSFQGLLFSFSSLVWW